MAEPSVPSDDPPGPTDAQRNAMGVRVLVIIGVTLVVLMVVFGRATSKGYDQFTAYQDATLKDPDNPPRWTTEALDVDGCVDASLAWIEACPGVSSWCESSLPDVMGQCLDTQYRGAYCASVGDAVRSTRFGFDECSARYDQIKGRYARRYAKKHCSLIFRVIAGYCEPTGG
ncbi:hypothetical protein DB30_00218 [Enhygromyxa salina]|uniref:Uncharacterized protein n=1 Tax=Enhygromyxa salina TaxID=215803 RepID=A0A0C2A535_9BACT|nr:hypothetical protein [Enhygromyxa salina]KIG18533.1 hypothetical protein DB30_00218 [Enhygromyxa salina]